MKHLKGLLMPVGVLLAAAVAFGAPAAVKAVLPTSVVPPLLGVVMFGMGLTLRARDFLPVLTHPGAVALGVAAQFSLMPLIAVALVHALGLPEELALGVVLVGCCPGGTASNVIAYLAKGDVALSVAMTSVSTLLAPLATPALCALCADRTVAVDAPALALSVAQVVLLPIALGVAANELLPKAVARVRAAMPVFSTAVVVVIVAAVMAVNAERVRAGWGLVVAAVVLHNLLGMAAGWGAARAFGLAAAQRRTLAVEVGMQNSGLAVSLATLHFAAYPLAAVPGALFSVWHNLSGSLYAAWCAARPVAADD